VGNPSRATPRKSSREPVRAGRSHPACSSDRLGFSSIRLFLAADILLLTIWPKGQGIAQPCLSCCDLASTAFPNTQKHESKSTRGKAKLRAPPVPLTSAATCPSQARGSQQKPRQHHAPLSPSVRSPHSHAIARGQSAPSKNISRDKKPFGGENRTHATTLGWSHHCPSTRDGGYGKVIDLNPASDTLY
jgi:hypothetical protein